VDFIISAASLGKSSPFQCTEYVSTCDTGIRMLYGRRLRYNRDLATTLKPGNLPFGWLRRAVNKQNKLYYSNLLKHILFIINIFRVLLVWTEKSIPRA